MNLTRRSALVYGDRSLFLRCRFLAHQNTL